MAIARCYLTLGGSLGCTYPGGHEGPCEKPKEVQTKVTISFSGLATPNIEKTYSVIPNIGDRVWIDGYPWRVATREFSNHGDISLIVENSERRYDKEPS